MLDNKKSEKANLEHRRTEMFLVALVIIFSCVFAALEWKSVVPDVEYGAEISEIIENIDFNKLKKEQDMLVAVIPQEKPKETPKLKVVDEAAEESSEEIMPDEQEAVGADSQTETEGIEESEPEMLAPVNSEPVDYQVVEQLPEFPGGASAFMKWITANVKYPKFAQERKLEGKVVISFLVDTEGNVTRMRIEKSNNRELGIAVLQVMETMPKWKPGISEGKPCTTMVAVPINFEI